MATRRKFIKDGLIVSAGVSLLGCGKTEKSLFSDSERKCAIAISEQIIPADESCGGATEAGVVNFIENWFSKYRPEEYDGFLKNLRAFQAMSAAELGKDFQDADFAAQNKLLLSAERGEIKSGKMSGEKQREFFDKILSLTMYGFYGAPRHGGNKNAMSFKMMGWDNPLVVGQNRYAKRASR